MLMLFDDLSRYIRLFDPGHLTLSIRSRLEVFFEIDMSNLSLLKLDKHTLPQSKLYPHNWPFYTLVMFGFLPFSISLVLVFLLGVRTYLLNLNVKIGQPEKPIVLFCFYTFLFYFLFIGLIKDTIQNSMFWFFVGLFSMFPTKRYGDEMICHVTKK